MVGLTPPAEAAMSYAHYEALRWIAACVGLGVTCGLLWVMVADLRHR